MLLLLLLLLLLLHLLHLLLLLHRHLLLLLHVVLHLRVHVLLLRVLHLLHVWRRRLLVLVLVLMWVQLLMLRPRPVGRLVLLVGPPGAAGRRATNCAVAATAGLLTVGHLLPQPGDRARWVVARRPRCWLRARLGRRPKLVEEHKVVGLRVVALQAVVLGQKAHQLRRRAVVAEHRRRCVLLLQHVIEEYGADARALAALVHVKVEHAQRRHLRIVCVGLAPHEELLGADLEQAPRKAVRRHGQVEPLVRAARHRAVARDRLAQALCSHRPLAQRVDHPSQRVLLGAAEALERRARDEQDARLRGHAARQEQLLLLLVVALHVFGRA